MLQILNMTTKNKIDLLVNQLGEERAYRILLSKAQDYNTFHLNNLRQHLNDFKGELTPSELCYSYNSTFGTNLKPAKIGILMKELNYISKTTRSGTVINRIYVNLYP